MKKIVYEYYRPVKGFDGTHLILKGRVEAAFLDGKCGDISVEIFFSMKGLGHSVRHGYPLQNLSERHHHARTVTLFGKRHCRDAV